DARKTAKRNRAHARCECHDLAPVAQGAAGASARISCDPRGGHPYRMRRGGDRIAELQLENSRLRRLVTDLLLEKIKLEEAAQRLINADVGSARWKAWYDPPLHE